MLSRNFLRSTLQEIVRGKSSLDYISTNRHISRMLSCSGTIYSDDKQNDKTSKPKQSENKNDAKEVLEEPIKFSTSSARNFSSRDYYFVGTPPPRYQPFVIVCSLTCFLLYCYFRDENDLDLMLDGAFVLFIEESRLKKEILIAEANNEDLSELKDELNKVLLKEEEIEQDRRVKYRHLARIYLQ